jgi:FkbM family methyltransferase
MTEKIILFGAGACGRYVIANLRSQGITPLAFAENDKSKWGRMIDGVPVCEPTDLASLHKDATWVATVISAPAREIRQQMREMLVKTAPLYEVLPCHHGLPPDKIRDTLFPAIGDVVSKIEFNDQCVFRRSGDYNYQMSPSPISELYFPPFIKHRDDEHFVDCGAADGDTVAEFRKRWSNYSRITAFEPDTENYRKLALSCLDDPRNHTFMAAVADFNGKFSFTKSGDYSSHLGGNDVTQVVSLDETCDAPTYIKMDIEGSELEAIWGARRLLKEYSPVLAVCAYHTSDHLWQIPLLIHAIQPDYKLFLRRYAEGAWELVWYAVPPERIVL